LLRVEIRELRNLCSLKLCSLNFCSLNLDPLKLNSLSLDPSNIAFLRIEHG